MLTAGSIGRTGQSERPLGPIMRASAYTHQPLLTRVRTDRDVDEDGTDELDESSDPAPAAPRLGRALAGRAGTRPCRVVRRFRRGVRGAVRGARGLRNVPAARSHAAPRFVPGPQRSRRRRPGRGPHLHLLRARRRRRPHQQLARPCRDALRARRPLPRCDARPHHVRRAVLDGPVAVSDRAHRYRAHRLRLRRREHEAHDPHGPRSARRARDRRPVRAVRALGRRATRTRSARRALAVQPRPQVHRALPRDARDLVVRIRIRRQRAARQEVLRAADRVDDGARPRLARGAHADPQAHEPRERGALRRRGVPVGVRQDQPRDARADTSRLDRRDDRRRHLLDEVRGRRAAARDQPGVRDVRRRTRNERRDEPQRARRAPPRHRVHERRAHRRRRRVVGRHDPRASGARGRLARQRVDSFHGHGRGPPEQPVHRSARAGAVGRSRVGGPRRRSDLGDPLRWPARERRAARDRGLRLGPRCVPRLDHGVGDHRGRGGCRRQSSPRPVRDVAVLRLPHGRLLRALALDRGDDGSST
jgi:hypothetical protein